MAVQEYKLYKFLLSSKGEENHFGRFYYLNYDGINIFFDFSKKEGDKIYLYELNKKIYKLPSGEKVEIIDPKFRPAKKPMCVPKKVNAWQKSTFYGTLKNGKLYIDIPLDSYLFQTLSDIYNTHLRVKNIELIELKEETEKGLIHFYWPLSKTHSKKENKENFIFEC